MKTFALEPIEKASRDELQALQLARMRASLQCAYDKVPHSGRNSMRMAFTPAI